MPWTYLTLQGPEKTSLPQGILPNHAQRSLIHLSLAQPTIYIFHSIDHNCWWLVLNLLPHSSVGKESACNARDLGLIPGQKILWRRGRLPTPVFWPEEFQGLYSPWGCKELDMTEGLSLSLTNNLPLSLCPHSQGHLIYSNIFFAPCLAKVDAQLIIKARCSKEQVFHVEHMPLDWASKYKAN